MQDQDQVLNGVSIVYGHNQQLYMVAIIFGIHYYLHCIV